MEHKTFDLKRMLIHVPVGVLSGVFIQHLLIIGLVFTAAWFYYEWNEDENIRDHAFLDVWGFLVGMGIIGVVYLGIGIVK
jgi:hypothetical protein